MNPVNLPPTEPESEAALAIKAGDWIEVCIPTGANLYEYPHLQGAVIQVQSVEPRLQELTAANLIWPAHNVRKVDHPTELRQRLEAMERDRLRLVKAKGLDVGALESRVKSIESDLALIARSVAEVATIGAKVCRSVDTLESKHDELKAAFESNMSKGLPPNVSYRMGQETTPIVPVGGPLGGA